MLELLLWRRAYERIAEAIRDLLQSIGGLCSLSARATA
jgi:hypothetical protein